MLTSAARAVTTEQIEVIFRPLESASISEIGSRAPWAPEKKTIAMASPALKKVPKKKALPARSAAQATPRRAPAAKKAAT
jgi:hypothetical protein